MKTLLIDPTAYFHSFGLRMLATQLTTNGHQVEMAFALGQCPTDERADSPFLDSLSELLAGVGLVGVTVYTNYLLEAIAVSRWVRRRSNAAIVWGGVHPTVLPEPSLEHADFVVVGEAEDALVALAAWLEAGRQGAVPANVWQRDATGAPVAPALRPLARSLDDYGWPMYGRLEATFVPNGTAGALVPLTTHRLTELSALSGRYYGLDRAQPYHGYLTMGSRGCPYQCAYCINNAVNRLFQRKADVFRFRTVGHVIAEIEAVRAQFPFLDFVFFFDDNFGARPLAQIEEFCALYRQRINVPFKCNVHPNNLSEAKLDLLVAAGLVSVEMGIESGSERTNRELYGRPHSNANIIRIAQLLHRKHRGRVVSYYDVIMDNPWERHEDVSDTIRLVQELPRPFRLSHFSLTFFPGTQLYERAVREGLVTDLVRDVVLKRNNRLYAARDPYSKLLLSVSPFVTTRAGRSLLRLLAHPALLRWLNGRLPAWIVRGLMGGMIAGRTRYNGWRSRLRTRRMGKTDARAAA